MIELQDGVNYLKYLFKVTNEKYSTGRTKIAKLLSIAAFKYAQENKKMFQENIYEYINCGCIIQNINHVMNVEFYLKWEYFDEEMIITESFGDTEMYIEDKQIREIIKDVFINFGAYSIKSLNKYLNELIFLNGMRDEKGMILLYNFLILDKQLFYKYPKNKVIQYLFT